MSLDENMIVLARHRQAFLDTIDCDLSEASVVLEIGAGDGLLGARLGHRNPGAIVLSTDLGVLSSQQGNLYRFHMDAQAMPLPDGCVDLCISHNAFEHIPDLDQAWSEIQRVLKPGGQVRARFAPVWSAAYGHHWYADDGSHVESAIPPYGHLYMSRRELAARIRSNTRFLSIEQRFAYQCLLGNQCNRLLPDDYRRIFADARLTPFLERYHDRQPPVGLAASLGVAETDLGLLGFDLAAEKVDGSLNDVRLLLPKLLRQSPPRRRVLSRFASMFRTVFSLYLPNPMGYEL